MHSGLAPQEPFIPLILRRGGAGGKRLRKRVQAGRVATDGASPRGLSPTGAAAWSRSEVVDLSVVLSVDRLPGYALVTPPSIALRPAISAFRNHVIFGILCSAGCEIPRTGACRPGRAGP